MSSEMFQAAFQAVHDDPPLEELVRRFNAAFERTQGDTHSAMAAVNEVIERPLSYAEFLTMLRAA
jgi:hypothetical protein